MTVCMFVRLFVLNKSSVSDPDQRSVMKQIPRDSIF